MAVDTTGINVAKIGAMKNAIEGWAKAVDDTKITVAAKNVTAALKGSNQQAEVKKLCMSCDSYTKLLTDKLRAYEKRLEDVKTAYENNDASATAFTNVKNQIDKLKS